MLIPIERSKQGTQEISMIPLINLVFLLLVFFLVAGTIEKFDIIQLDIPEAESGKVLDEGHVVIVLGSRNEILLNDEFMLEGRLGEALTVMLKRNPKRVVTLKADARLPAQRLIRVMDILKAAGVQNLSLVTQSAEEA